MTLDVLSVIDGELARAKRPCVTSSFQADCVVLLHLLLQRFPDIPVLFIDTAHHFAETIAYRDRIVADWKLNVVNVHNPEPQVGLWQTSTRACCAHNKVGPLFAALEAYDTWFAALRREQSASRASVELIADFRLPTGRTLRKVSPLVQWATRDIEGYAYTHQIPLLPLYARGYTSIGCEPCTTLPTDPSNSRSGRWLGQKLECGIHLDDPSP